MAKVITQQEVMDEFNGIKRVYVLTKARKILWLAAFEFKFNGALVAIRSEFPKGADAEELQVGSFDKEGNKVIMVLDAITDDMIEAAAKMTQADLRSAVPTGVYDDEYLVPFLNRGLPEDTE